MPVELTSGDLLALADLDAIAHGCNCAGVMGKGIALSIKKRWPQLYAEYRQLCKEHRFKLGDVFAWSDGKITIFNLATQPAPGKPASMAAIEQALERMLQIATERRIPSIGLPRIGAGLGKLSWPPIRDLIARVGSASPVRLVVFEEYRPETGEHEG